MPVSQHDRDIIRGLATRAAEIAALPVMHEKRELWTRLNRLVPVERQPGEKALGRQFPR